MKRRIDGERGAKRAHRIRVAFLFDVDESELIANIGVARPQFHRLFELNGGDYNHWNNRPRH